MSNVMTAPVVPEEEAPQRGGRKRVLLVGLLVVLLGGGAGWWFLLRPASAEEAPTAGEVMTLEAIQVNLAGNHYLRIGIALQATDEVKEELDGSKALDATIELFTGQRMEDLARKPYREQLKRKLEHHLDEVYEGEVMGVYFTDFVTQ
jgi:flagellar FliL protein